MLFEVTLRHSQEHPLNPYLINNVDTKLLRESLCIRCAIFKTEVHLILCIHYTVPLIDIDLGKINH